MVRRCVELVGAHAVASSRVGGGIASVPIFGGVIHSCDGCIVMRKPGWDYPVFEMTEHRRMYLFVTVLLLPFVLFGLVIWADNDKSAGTAQGIDIYVPFE